MADKTLHSGALAASLGLFSRHFFQSPHRSQPSESRQRPQKSNFLQHPKAIRTLSLPRPLPTSRLHPVTAFCSGTPENDLLISLIPVSVIRTRAVLGPYLYFLSNSFLPIALITNRHAIWFYLLISFSLPQECK